VGQQGTLLFGDFEILWGYRHVVKTMQDLYKVRGAADLGIAGRFRLTDGVNVNAMMSNGDGFGSRDDGGIGTYHKAYEVHGLFTPVDGLLISAFFGINGFDVDGDPSTDDSKNMNTIDLLACYDSLDPNTAVGDDTKTYLVIGLDYRPAQGFSIIPNFRQEMVGSSNPEGTFLLTFYWKW